MTSVPFQEYMGLFDEEYTQFQDEARKRGMSEREFFEAMMNNLVERHPAPEMGIGIENYIVPQEVLDDQERARAVVRKHRGMDDDDEHY